MSIISEIYDENVDKLNHEIDNLKRQVIGLKGENTRLKKTNNALEEDLRSWENFLKENVPKMVFWHDLTKNPGDLPKADCRNYLAISIFDDEPAIYHYIAGGENGQWEAMPHRVAYMSNDQIKKWCEIPKEN